MSWLSSFFRKDSTKALFNLARKILSIFVGRVADDLQKAAMLEVRAAEQSGKSGIDKYEAAFKVLRERFHKLPEYAINIAIETAVAQIDPKH